jgi:hypothetical protein
MLLEVGTMRKRSKVAVIVAIAVIIAGAGAFYLVSPLFISTQLNEPCLQAYCNQNHIRDLYR